MIGRSERVDEFNRMQRGNSTRRVLVAAIQLVEYAKRMARVIPPRAREGARRRDEGAHRVADPERQDLDLLVQGYRYQPTAGHQHATQFAVEFHGRVMPILVTHGSIDEAFVNDHICKSERLVSHLVLVAIVTKNQDAPYQRYYPQSHSC